MCESAQCASKNYKAGYCPAGTVIYKRIVCGKEYCPECGKIDSIIHKRRVSRWFKKLFSYKSVGYFVITVPAEIRDKFKDREILSEWKKFSIRYFKNLGYESGLFRFHWYGDCKHCKGDEKGCIECKFTGAGTDWCPHINILTEGKFLTKEVFKTTLNMIKYDFKMFYESLFGIDLTGKENAFYEYRKTDKQKMHVLKYVTRSTFRIYNKEIAGLLKGFRASQTWGKFGKCLHESENNELIMLESGLCPCCKQKIVWKDGLIVNIKLSKLFYDYIDGGYIIGKNKSG